MRWAKKCSNVSTGLQRKPFVSKDARNMGGLLELGSSTEQRETAELTLSVSSTCGVVGVDFGFVNLRNVVAGKHSG
jgi:hypothetical protein